MVIKTIQEKEVSILMTYNKIKKIEVAFDENLQAFTLVFDGKLLETQRKVPRSFKGLTQVANFFHEIDDKSIVESEMQEKDLLFHLNQDGINMIEIIKGKDGFYIIFNLQSIKVQLVTQKSKKRVFKSLSALMSFLKSFFDQRVYSLESIIFINNDVREEFKKENGKNAYENFVLKLATP